MTEKHAGEIAGTLTSAVSLKNHFLDNSPPSYVTVSVNLGDFKCLSRFKQHIAIGYTTHRVPDLKIINDNGGQSKQVMGLLHKCTISLKDLFKECLNLIVNLKPHSSAFNSGNCL